VTTDERAPHPNDMTFWAEIGCRRGCEVHATTNRRIFLGGPTGYRDLTGIPRRFTETFEIEVWDTSITPVDGGPYCPARDAVSETILSHGIWEPAETAVLLCCFETAPGGLFIDFGSQIGWFSTIAARRGMNVIALDADPECVNLSYQNLYNNAPLLTSVGAHWERLGPDVARFGLHDEPRLTTIAKIDVEGAERWAIRKLQPLIDERWVTHILIEISPVFNDTYPDLVVGLLEDGYHAYCLPPKHNPPHMIAGLEDLIPWHIAGTHAEIRREVASWHQRDVLFVLGGI
jgi:hypothetical protein